MKKRKVKVIKSGLYRKLMLLDWLQRMILPDFNLVLFQKIKSENLCLGQIFHMRKEEKVDT